MTQTEMEETEGAALPLLLVLGGGATAAWKNHYDSYKETGGPASVTDTIRATGEGALIGASLYGGGGVIQPVTGGITKWVRVGNSYSKSGDFPTKAVRWGSNPRHNKEIGNETLREMNKKLHDTKISIDSWRTKDKGHFHF